MPSAPVTRAGRPVRDTPAESLPEIAGGLARGLAGRRIADDAALAHPLRPHLELRLDQGEEPGPGPGKVEGRREDLRQPDETGVADHDIGRLGHQGRVQATGVQAFEGHYAGIRAQAGVKLSATDIDGEDLPGPAPKADLGKAPGRGADIQDDRPFERGPVESRRGLELASRPADLLEGGPEGDLGFRCDEVRSARHLATVSGHPSSLDGGAGPGATRGEPAFSEDGVGSPPGGASRRGVRHGHSLSRKSA